MLTGTNQGIAMHQTRNSLPEKVRSGVIDVLSPRLADLLELYAQVKQAHWNVKGPNFIGLHELFDDIAEDVEDHGDTVAERIVQLGGRALGTSRRVAESTTLKDYPAKIVRDADHVKALSDVLAKAGATIRAAIDECSALGDADSADICTQISRALDKHLWMVESHGQKFA